MKYLNSSHSVDHIPLPILHTIIQMLSYVFLIHFLNVFTWTSIFIHHKWSSVRVFLSLSFTIWFQGNIVAIELEEQLFVPVKNMPQTIHVMPCKLTLEFLVGVWKDQEYKSQCKTFSVKSIGISFHFLLSLSWAPDSSFLWKAENWIS